MLRTSWLKGLSVRLLSSWNVKLGGGQEGSEDKFEAFARGG